MKNKAKFYRQIVGVIGITLLVAGSPGTSRSDDGRDFADKSNFAKIDVPGSAGYTAPNGINAQGDIVGTYGAILNNNAISRGFLLSKGTFTNIDVNLPGAIPGSTNATGINAQGGSIRKRTWWDSSLMVAATGTGFCGARADLPKSMSLQPLASGRKRMGSTRKATSWVSILTAAA
jgi:hypothetical protein